MGIGFEHSFKQGANLLRSLNDIKHKIQENQF